MGYKKWTQSAAQLEPDTRYNSELVSKFINCIMWSGKKSTATRVFYDAMDIIAKRVKDEPTNEVFEKAIDNCRPNVEVRSKRVGGSNYQVPMPVNRKRQQSLAFRWIRDAARKGGGRRLSRWPGSSWTPTRVKEPRSRPRTTCIGWPRRTRHLPISPGRRAIIGS